MELLVAVNPDADSRLPYLLWVPVGAGLVFRTSGTWPRTKALYCHPVPLTEWPADHDLAAAPTAPDPSTAEVRKWARRSGLDVPDRGRLRPEIWQSWRPAHPPEHHPPTQTG